MHIFFKFIPYFVFYIFFKISIYISFHNTKLSITVFKFYVYLNAAHLQIQKRMTQKKREKRKMKKESCKLNA